MMNKLKINENDYKTNKIMVIVNVSKWCENNNIK